MLALAFRLHDACCVILLRVLLRVALAVDEHRRRAPRRCEHWFGSLTRLLHAWRGRERSRPPASPLRRSAWNRTPDVIEQRVVRLHVDYPMLGAGQLRWLAERVLGFRAARETFRKILLRRRDLVVALQRERRRRRPLDRSGAQGTLVWIFGIVLASIVHAWILHVVDHDGRDVFVCPTSGAMARVLLCWFRFG